MARADKEFTAVAPQLRFKLPKFEASNIPDSGTHDANAYFAKMFPESTSLFGPAFLQATFNDADGLPRFVPAELNIDFFAHALGGDRRLGHRVVYYEPEERFYFFDPRLDAYCPTSEDKLEALLSNYLVKCAQEAGFLVEIRPLFGAFREHKLLKKVIKRAKALLAADRTFFSGEHGNRRMVDGKIVEPTAKPSYEVFAEKALAKEPSSALTVTDAWHRYYSFCRGHQIPPLTRQEFKSLLAEVVREQYGCGLRRDVPGQNGKAQEGWIGLGLRLPDTAEVGLS